MGNQITHMYTLQEAAEGYAAAAERLFGTDNYLDKASAVVPIFVSNLFQSLEISIKAAGIESGLFTMEEARGPARDMAFRNSPTLPSRDSVGRHQTLSWR
ncbi:MAG: hypothetical protein ACUBOA_10940 [Candidatus Loosdrechtia sp.]|uniref:hypothetical protein n=1 Tax=Candidatus Loosdrechtia sp. TaxID=3101272 RepID=UPI003A76D0D3|nr:MAG: hypothetical protein QY305_07950 [Candidatus Jettenia sp. AMX2]